MRALACSLVALLALACSHVEVRRVGDDADARGIRFYRPEPYLLVTGKKDGSLATAIVYLPNKAEEYVVRPRVGLGTLELNVELENGWNLVGLGQELDPRVPETLTAVTGALSAVPGFRSAASDGSPSLALAPGLYRLLFDRDGHVAGIAEVDLGAR